MSQEVGQYPSKLKKMNKPRIMNTDVNPLGGMPPGPDTVGGVVGGKYDKGVYNGLKAFSKPGGKSAGN